MVESPHNPAHPGDVGPILLPIQRTRRGITGAQKLARGWASLAVLLVVVGAIYFGYVGVRVEQVLLPVDIHSFGGVGYAAYVPPWNSRYPLVFRSDSLDNNNASRASLFENGVKLGPRHTLHSNIANLGNGSYSHWGEAIIFSASDNSDPRTNGRTYIFGARARLLAAWFWPVTGAGTLFLGAVWLAPPIRRWWREPNAQAPGGILRLPLAVRRWWPNAEARGRVRTAVARGTLQGAVTAALGLFAVAVPGLVHGAVFWLVLGAALVFMLLSVRNMAIAVLLLCRSDRALGSLQNAALVIAAVSVSLAGFELYLAFAERSAVDALKASGSPASGTLVENRNPELQADGTLRLRTGHAEIILPASLAATMQERHDLITMPTDWTQERVTVPGATWAYRWQGVVHIFDQDNYRRLNGPFSPKDPSIFRILATGDSITYGAGIEATWSYPAQLQRLLEKNYRVEVINLGQNGAQSEDVLRSIEKMTPILKPDLIIYGVCLNDFLPSGVGQYNYSYSVPIPLWLKTAALERTRLAHLFDDAYQALLLSLHVRQDFFDDILSNFGDYQNRFGVDVTHMNEFAQAQGLPPIVGIVLDQFPNYGDRGYRIAMVADTQMRKAKFDLIPAEDYYKSYDGRQFVVSRWEAHPNEEADAIFATRIADHLYGRSDLERYRK